MLRLTSALAADFAPLSALPGAVATTVAVATALAGASSAAIAIDLVPASAALPVVLVFLAVLWIVLRFLPDHRPVPRFGAANMVTFVRGAITAWLAGCSSPAIRVESVGWWVAGAAGLAVALDGVDGLLARRRREASAFGARFDMETDALLLLVLSALAVGADRLGPWVLAIGLMRYAFVGAARLWPMLNAPLSPSFRRKAIAAFQGLALTAVFLPVLTDGQAALIAGTALVALAGSFARDVAYLIRRGGAPSPA